MSSMMHGVTELSLGSLKRTSSRNKLLIALAVAMSGGLYEAAPCEAQAPATVGFRFTLSATESVPHSQAGYETTLRVVLESRGSEIKGPSALKPGDSVRFVQVELVGSGQGWNGSDRQSFSISAPEPRHKNTGMAELLVTSAGAKLKFSMPFLPDGSGRLHFCLEKSVPLEFSFSLEELSRWSTLQKALQGRIENQGDPSCTGKFAVKFSGGKADDSATKGSVVGPQCSCEAGKVLEFSAAGDTDLDFKPFEVTSEGAKPEVILNQAGKTPRLQLRGDGKVTGRTTVVAVFRKKGKLSRSAPHVVSFANLEPVVEVNTQSKVGDHDYIFSGSGKTLTMPLRGKGWFNGSAAGDRLKWEMEERGEKLFEFDKAQGESVTASATALPQKVDAFGARQVIERLEDGPCTCTQKHSVRLFFARDEKTNPEGLVPNWDFYWQQTVAGRGFPHKVVPVIPSSWAHQDAPNALARYDAGVDIIFVRAAFPQIGCVSRPSGDVDKGIDCYAQTLRHETRHRSEFLSWWGPKLEKYSWAQDPDVDYVPSNVEDQWGCNWLAQQSCPSLPAHLLALGVMDIEATAYAEGWKWKPGDANSVDWGCPGKQTKGCGAE